jgi:hypothetical protein
MLTEVMYNGGYRASLDLHVDLLAIALQNPCKHEFQFVAHKIMTQDPLGQLFDGEMEDMTFPIGTILYETQHEGPGAPLIEDIEDAQTPICGVPIKDLPPVLDAVYLERMAPTLTSIQNVKKYLGGLSLADQERLLKGFGAMFRLHKTEDAPTIGPKVSIDNLAADDWGDDLQAAIQELKHPTP